MKCECGSNRFYAQETLHRICIVDGDGEWIEGCNNANRDISSIDEPYKCVKCGKVYNELVSDDNLCDVCEQPVSDGDWYHIEMTAGHYECIVE